MSDANTIRELWSQTTAVVGERHTARWLLEVATSLDGKDFDAALDEPVTERMVAHLDSMLARHRAGEPLQYVLGRWGFRRLDLSVDSRVLIPRPETELVVEVTLALAIQIPAPRLIADLGTGSGAIGLALADELALDGTTVWITDASEAALDVARANLAGIGRAARNVIVNHGSWFDALPTGERFDVIVSNPPYVADDSSDIEPIVSEWEPHDALFAGEDGLADIRWLIANAADHLSGGGWLVLEIGADQGEMVRELYKAAGFAAVEIRNDLAGHPRVALGQKYVTRR